MGTPMQMHPRRPRILFTPLDQNPTTRFRPLKGTQMSTMRRPLRDRGLQLAHAATPRHHQPPNDAFWAGSDSRLCGNDRAIFRCRRVLCVYDVRSVRSTRIHRPRPLRHPPHREPHTLALARMDKLPTGPALTYRFSHADRPMDHFAPRAAALLLAVYCAC
jgi:hypothetical protein